MQVLGKLPSSFCSFFIVLSLWHPFNSIQELYIKGNVFSVISDTIGGFCRQAAKLGRLYRSLSLPLLASESLLTRRDWDTIPSMAQMLSLSRPSVGAAAVLQHHFQCKWDLFNC